MASLDCLYSNLQVLLDRKLVVDAAEFHSVFAKHYGVLWYRFPALMCKIDVSLREYNWAHIKSL